MSVYFDLIAGDDSQSVHKHIKQKTYRSELRYVFLYSFCSSPAARRVRRFMFLRAEPVGTRATIANKRGP